jgi:hypothetical protein
MSRQGRFIAQQHGEGLPEFVNATEAGHYYHFLRDKHLALLFEAASNYPSIHLDYSPESLKQLEQWYFRLYETDSFPAVGIDRETFETCMAMYFGETTMRSAHAQWIVESYFLMPNRYEFGVRKGSFTMMLTRFKDHFREPNNKKRDSLFRRYKKYFARGT